MNTRESLRTQSRKLALSGLLCALAVAVLMLGSLLSVAVYCAPILAMILLLPIREEYSPRLYLTAWAAVFLLTLLIAPDRELAGVFLVWGWYPAAQPLFHRIPWKGLRRFCTAAAGALSTAALYAALLYVFQLGTIVEEFQDYTTLLMAALLGMSCILFLLTDRILLQFSRYWRHSRLRRLWQHASS